MAQQTKDYNRLAVMNPLLSNNFSLLSIAVESACKKEVPRSAAPPRAPRICGGKVGRCKWGDIKWGDMPSTLMWRPYETTNRRTL